MTSSYDVICFSHLRWDFVFQRPQQLLSRIGGERRVFFVEEPTFDSPHACVDVRRVEDQVYVVVTRLPEGTGTAEAERLQRQFLDALVTKQKITRFVAWYYSPMALQFSRHLRPIATVYDCMDELTAFHGAPALLPTLETELLRKADVVFTGGHSLYRAKLGSHRNIHPMPSSVDRAHFAKARRGAKLSEPADQVSIPHPRAGFFGVVDERMDLELVARVAALRPSLQLVMVGPVVKIDPATLPRAANIHWLGGKRYAELPAYIASWDVALLPFARNEATRFISPTKTPEYLAAGKPVVSTSIRDVVSPYGELGLALIADEPEAFAAAIDVALSSPSADHLTRADELLSRMSWERTLAEMVGHIDAVLSERPRSSPALAPSAQLEAAK